MLDNSSDENGLCFDFEYDSSDEKTSDISDTSTQLGNDDFIEMHTCSSSEDEDEDNDTDEE